MLISIVIPLFNEEENIPEIREQIDEALRDTGFSYEVILVDDGSTDGSRDKLSELAEIDRRYKVIEFRRNFGQTAAMMAGFDHTAGDIIIPMDGDLQNDPKDIPRLIEKIESGYDVCSGWRKNRKDDALRRNFPSRMANRLISSLSGVHLHDYGCSLKAYRKDVIEGIRLYGEMHRFIPIYASWQGARITEVEMTHHPRTGGKSKYGMERTFKVILDLLVVLFFPRFPTNRSIFSADSELAVFFSPD